MYQNSFLDTMAGQRFVEAIVSISESLEKIANSKNNSGAIDAQTIEKIYRKREHQYRVEDAKSQYLDYLFGDNIDYTDSDVEFALSSIEKEKGKNIWDIFVGEFEKKKDCNIADNDTWQNAIREVLQK